MRKRSVCRGLCPSSASDCWAWRSRSGSRYSVCMYALGPISGAHLNPAVSFGLAISGRFAWRDLPGYVLAQLAGAIIASGLLLLLLRGQPGGYDIRTWRAWRPTASARTHRADTALPQGSSAETVLTFIFLIVVLGSTRHSSAHAGIAIGFTLTLVHLIGIPITNVSGRPGAARPGPPCCRRWLGPRAAIDVLDRPAARGGVRWAGRPRPVRGPGPGARSGRQEARFDLVLPRDSAAVRVQTITSTS